jgi:hypothetical protein
MTVELQDVLRRNLAQLLGRARAAAERAGRLPDEVTIVAVTKSAPLEAVRTLYELGWRDFGESRPQQLQQRAAQLPIDVRWHLIGHLQRNKAGSACRIAHWIHSVDSWRLLERIAALLPSDAPAPKLLLEVNVSGEASKDGFAPQDLLEHWPRLLVPGSPLPCGLMTMAPLSEAPETVRPVFRGLRELRDELRERSAGQLTLPHLSMGMSGDFEIAIEEGATLIRVGSLLFEGVDSALSRFPSRAEGQAP